MQARITLITVLVILLGGTVCEAGDKSPPAPTPSQAGVIPANQPFALDLYARLRTQEGNLCLSPHSIATTLSLLQVGARGETAKQLAAILRQPAEPDKLPPALAVFQTAPNQTKPRGYQIHSAAALWGQKGLGFQPAYLKALQHLHGAGLHEVDFQGEATEACKAINGWVEEQTQKKIKELVGPGQIDSQTVLVLTSALYFQGDWASPFPKDQTKNGLFRIGKGKKVTTAFMHQKATFNYGDAGLLEVLELPYAGGDVSLVVLLPKEATELSQVEKTLTAAKLETWLAKLKPTRLDVALPRFTLAAEVPLADVLRAMGLAGAFSGAADFSGMLVKKGTAPVSAVVHKAMVEVNEQGTVAAAATAVIKSRDISPLFHADRPFLFLIQDRHSGGILLLGRMARP